MITEDNIKLMPVCFWAFDGVHVAKYRDDEHKIELEVYTPKSKRTGKFGKEKRFYFIDGDDREFATLDSLIEAYNEKFQFEEENPEMEVKYVKVVKKRTK